MCLIPGDWGCSCGRASSLTVLEEVSDSKQMHVMWHRGKLLKKKNRTGETGNSGTWGRAISLVPAQESWLMRGET